jgi:hypothetical protein
MLNAKTLSTLIIFMGAMDCLTTALGVRYFGTSESNPLMAAIISTNIGVFLTVKITATLLMALTYVLASRALMGTSNKTSNFFKYSCRMIELAYAGIIAFLSVVVTNNLLILIA